MLINNLKYILGKTCYMSETQIKLTILAMLTIVFQGIIFYIIDNKGIRIELFAFVILFGFIYNVVYFKTFIN
jgi:hypothetical protein